MKKSSKSWAITGGITLWHAPLRRNQQPNPSSVPILSDAAGKKWTSQAYMKALSTSLMSRYEASEIVPGSSANPSWSAKGQRRKRCRGENGSPSALFRSAAKRLSPRPASLLAGSLRRFAGGRPLLFATSTILILVTTPDRPAAIGFLQLAATIQLPCYGSANFA